MAEPIPSDCNADSVTIEFNRFHDLGFDLLTQNDILKEKLGRVDASYDDGELKTVWMMDSWSAADSMRRMEHRILNDRDELHKLDQSIVLMYMKILSYQSSKVYSTRYTRFYRIRSFNILVIFVYKCFQSSY